MKKSEIIKAFLDMIDDSEKKLRWARENRTKQDMLTQDLLHKLELGNYKSRNKIATQLAKCRKERRYYKDIEEETEAVTGWLSSAHGEQVLNELKQMLGTIRKVEKYHENRTYKPRVLKK
ncbi:MAG: hypothetical protein IJ526_00495 [Lachnospiraceae bacterium]|nr:hypothetical protein [Lachnospiraceae bacterium]